MSSNAILAGMDCKLVLKIKSGCTFSHGCEEFKIIPKHKLMTCLRYRQPGPDTSAACQTKCEQRPPWSASHLLQVGEVDCSEGDGIKCYLYAHLRSFLKLNRQGSKTENKVFAPQ